MTDAVAGITPDLKTKPLSGTIKHLARMLYMESVVHQRNHITNEQLQLINMLNDMERAAKRRTLMQKVGDFQKVLKIESECIELSSKLKTAESEKLKLKYYIAEENISGIKKYTEESEVLTNKHRRALLERDSQLRRIEDLLVIAGRQLRDLPHSEQECSTHLRLSELVKGSDTGVACRGELDGQGDKFEKALKTKDGEIAHLQHILNDQKEEMEMKCAALEEKLLKQMKDRESHMRALYEKDENIRRTSSDVEIHFREELSKKEHLKKELSTTDETLSGEL